MKLKRTGAALRHRGVCLKNAAPKVLSDLKISDTIEHKRQGPHPDKPASNTYIETVAPKTNKIDCALVKSYYTFVEASCAKV